MHALLAALVVTAIAYPGPIRPRDCDTVVDATALRIRPHSYDFYGMPTGDRSAYTTAEVVVTCRIDGLEGLGDCVTAPDDPRGPWLARQLRFWKVLDTELKGCPLAGRQIQFRFSFLADEGELRWRKGRRWEVPLNH